MTLIEFLKTIKDPRNQRGQRYPLWLLIFLSQLGSLCGYIGYRPLSQFCQKHAPTIRLLLGLAEQTRLLPSHSTFRRLFAQVEAKTWVDSFNVWVLSHAPQLAGQLCSIDGKSIKCTSSGGNSAQQDFACLVSLYGQHTGVVQLALMFNAQTSEIAVARQLLKAVHEAPALAGSLSLGFSLDALHAQVETLNLMSAQQQHYIVGLKTNQKTLYQQMVHLRTREPAWSQSSVVDRTHCRQVRRTVWVYAAPLDLPPRWRNAGITRVIWVKREGVRLGKSFEECHCYLSNWSLTAAEFQQKIRQHWQIENGLHWVKDVTLKEDYPPRRGKIAPISWAVIHCFLITLARRLHHRTLPDCIRDLTNQVVEVFAWLT